MSLVKVWYQDQVTTLWYSVWSFSTNAGEVGAGAVVVVGIGEVAVVVVAVVGVVVMGGGGEDRLIVAGIVAAVVS